MKKTSPITLISANASTRSAAAGVTAAAARGVNRNDTLLTLFEQLLGMQAKEDLLRSFHDWGASLALLDSLAFSAADGDEEKTFGTPRHHSANYELDINGNRIGHIRLSRRMRYQDTELELLERALGGLAQALLLSTELQRAREEALRDSLTGLFNRRAMDERLTQALLIANRHNTALSVMIIDIDHFKDINDQLGHQTGDAVLRLLATSIRASLRESDLMFRLGGDEFAVILPHTGATGAAGVAAKMHATMTQQETREGAVALPRISIGVAELLPGDDEKKLLQRADTHLYHAKAQGRGRVCSSV